MQINLLAPQTSMKKQIGFEQSSKVVLFSGIGVVAVLLLTTTVLFLLRMNAESNIKDVNSQILALNKVSQEINERNQMLGTINLKKATISKLEEGRPIWTTRLDSLEKLMPQNTSFSGIQFDNSSGKGAITGTAPGYEQVAQLVANLQGSPDFEKSVLNQVSRQEAQPGVVFNIGWSMAGGAKK